jgi:hypothetical protein
MHSKSRQNITESTTEQREKKTNCSTEHTCTTCLKHGNSEWQQKPSCNNR